ncbi:YybH family protein [Acidobacteriota bacterium]
MKKFLLVILPILLLSCAQQKMDVAGIESEILELTNGQQAAWNVHDIETFMADYWNSEEMTFQSMNNRLRGWANLLKRYETNYDGEQMGTLTFTDTEVNVLTPDYAYVIGRYNVEQPDGVKVGLYTIILQKIDGVWKIIHDHSS